MKVLWWLHLPAKIHNSARDRIAALLAGFPSSLSPEELRQHLLTPLSECFCGWLRVRWQERPPLDRADAVLDIRWATHQFVGQRDPPPNVLDVQLFNEYSMVDTVLPRRIRGIYRGAEESLGEHLVVVASALLDDTEFRLQGKTGQARSTRETQGQDGGADQVSLSERVRQAIERARADPNPGAAIDRILHPLGWNRQQWAAKVPVHRTVIYRWIIRRQRIRPESEDNLITALTARCREKGKADL
jgi:hypothetical protein